MCVCVLLCFVCIDTIRIYMVMKTRMSRRMSRRMFGVRSSGRMRSGSSRADAHDVWRIFWNCVNHTIICVEEATLVFVW